MQTLLAPQSYHPPSSKCVLRLPSYLPSERARFSVQLANTHSRDCVVKCGLSCFLQINSRRVTHNADGKNNSQLFANRYLQTTAGRSRLSVKWREWGECTASHPFAETSGRNKKRKGESTTTSYVLHYASPMQGAGRRGAQFPSARSCMFVACGKAVIYALPILAI